MLQVPPTGINILGPFRSGKESIYINPNPKIPLDERVCNTEAQCHLLPVQAEQVVSLG